MSDTPIQRYSDTMRPLCYNDACEDAPVSRLARAHSQHSPCSPCGSCSAQPPSGVCFPLPNDNSPLASARRKLARHSGDVLCATAGVTRGHLNVPEMEALLEDAGLAKTGDKLRPATRRRSSNASAQCELMLVAPAARKK
eukprot:2927773-Prymnesium_polylepis.1